ncbi:CTQ-dependent glycine oxidase GoxA [Labrenzia sp. 011]|uniref:CTQ-dependent glycine oxidase GoxA n=1 Tax=Labrenzia sp. 011 TaxID=2171494 RepID=UPI00197B0D89|nr:CTQ-dependent glycine oxidase GoxA [Labrenzia sp. 011]
MTGSNGIKRRDFLAQSTAALALTGLAFLPRPAVAQRSSVEPAPEGATPARVRIYPAIGISRVGGSLRWYLAPEVPGLPPKPEGGFKDGDRLIKKQVQRFRVYAFDDQDRVIGEIKADEAKIDWQVHLANTKAAWYGFHNPLDNGEDAPGLPGQMRNQYFVDDESREANLIIDGGLKEISGKDTNEGGGNPAYRFEGTFWGRYPVGLGELRTDSDGRLLVFPPDGKSGSPTNAPIKSFADNDGWYDDWCDGPVTATVTFPDGRKLAADPSWVASVGPNFAPEIPPITTLYDVIQNLNVSEGWTPPPASPLSFRRDIYPTFRRAALMDWLANAARHRSGWLDVDFSAPGFAEKLADPSPENEAFRRKIFSLFRNPENTGPEAYKEERLKIPYMLGDGVNYDGSPLQWFQFPALQYNNLKAWAAGDFRNDLDDPDYDSIETLDDVPLEQQPAALTEAALEPCSGGGFHPGVELSYYLRLAPMYARHSDATAEPFRLAHGNRPELVQTIGRLLTLEKALEGGNGAPPPVGPQSAGDLTRWMGLPWQCDAFSCQQVLLQENFPTAVWWPALLPIDVLPEDYYAQVMRPDLPEQERLKFLNSRVAWSRGVAGIGYHANASYWDGITNMITLWERMGFVVRKPAPQDPGRPEGVPDELYVETGRAEMEFRFNWSPADGMLPE